MSVLIVEQNRELARVWARALARQGFCVTLAQDADAAIEAMRGIEPEAIVVGQVPGEASALAVADYAAYRHPEARVIFVTASRFFSDGSIFAQSPNAFAFLPADTAPDDLAAVVEFHAGRCALAR